MGEGRHCFCSKSFEKYVLLPNSSVYYIYTIQRLLKDGMGSSDTIQWRIQGGGGGRGFNPPPPSEVFFFLLVSRPLYENSRGPVAVALTVLAGRIR